MWEKWAGLERALVGKREEVRLKKTFILFKKIKVCWPLLLSDTVLSFGNSTMKKGDVLPSWKLVTQWDKQN